MNIRPPVDVGDKLMVSIDAQGQGGQGIAKIDDFVIFVEKAEVGSRIKVIIEKCARTYANARRIE
ncbi:MAG: TRAM domain-containing protein [Candidatus Micrarchaeota archaeon]